jgi:hypothetical protein
MYNSFRRLKALTLPLYPSSQAMEVLKGCPKNCTPLVSRREVLLRLICKIPTSCNKCAVLQMQNPFNLKSSAGQVESFGRKKNPLYPPLFHSPTSIVHGLMEKSNFKNASKPVDPSCIQWDLKKTFRHCGRAFGVKLPMTTDASHDNGCQRHPLAKEKCLQSFPYNSSKSLALNMHETKSGFLFAQPTSTTSQPNVPARSLNRS